MFIKEHARKVRCFLAERDLSRHGGMDTTRFIFEKLAFDLTSGRIIEFFWVFGNNTVAWNDDVIRIFGEALANCTGSTRVADQ